jgi:DnaJ-class molecular chaperone
MRRPIDPMTCPVCDGRGVLPAARQAWDTDDPDREPAQECHACDGTGKFTDPAQWLHWIKEMKRSVDNRR